MRYAPLILSLALLAFVPNAWAATTCGSRTALSDRTCQGTEDVAFTLPNNESEIVYAACVNDAGDRFRLGDVAHIRWRISGGTFADVTTSSAVKFVTGCVLANATPVVAGERCTVGGDGAFIAGRENEAQGVSQVTEVRDDHTEWQFCLSFTDATENSTFNIEIEWHMKDATTTLQYINVLTVSDAGGARRRLVNVH